MTDTSILTALCVLGWACAGGAAIWIVALLHERDHLRGSVPRRDHRGRYASLRGLRP